MTPFLFLRKLLDARLAPGALHWFKAAAAEIAKVVRESGGGMSAVRAIGFHLLLRESTHDIRNEWAYLDQWVEDERNGTTHPDLQPVQQRLYADAIAREAQTPAFSGEWVERWFGVE